MEGRKLGVGLPGVGGAGTGRDGAGGFFLLDHGHGSNLSYSPRFVSVSVPVSVLLGRSRPGPGLSSDARVYPSTAGLSSESSSRLSSSWRVSDIAAADSVIDDCIDWMRRGFTECECDDSSCSMATLVGRRSWELVSISGMSERSSPAENRPLASLPSSSAIQ